MVVRGGDGLLVEWIVVGQVGLTFGGGFFEEEIVPARHKIIVKNSKLFGLYKGESVWGIPRALHDELCRKDASKKNVECCALFYEQFHVTNMMFNIRKGIEYSFHRSMCHWVLICNKTIGVFVKVRGAWIFWHHAAAQQALLSG